MNVKGINYHLISNGKGSFVAAVANTTDDNGNIVTITFDPISIVDTDKVYQAIMGGGVQTQDTPPQKPRPPTDVP